ncbi:hypothetical protein, partial [Mycoplasma sp. CSL7503-lung]|uniref:hypothetical protein n=1 Tax=Mycoplasma sp. CSL7503-lung TaxID=536372 RepID=UPI0021CDF4E2
MSKHFTFEQKVKYCKIIDQTDFKTALIQFLIDNEERYKYYWYLDKKQKRNRRPDRYGYTLLKKWYKRYNLSMDELKTKNKRGSGRTKKVKITDLNKDELELYHESIEELFKGKGISSSELWKIIKDKIQKKTMSSFNISKLSSFINV